MGIGFNCKSVNKDNHIYENYIGCSGHYSVGAVGATGVLKEINFKQGYISIQPSIVGFGNSARLEKKIPTIISMTQNNPLAIRPLKEGDLIKIVKEYKKDSDKKSK